MDVEECIFTRRSVRNFTSQYVSDDLIKEIIKAGIYAPNACNYQAWKFIVINDKEKKSLLHNYVADNAPISILVLYRNDIYVSGRKYYDYIQSASAAIENMSLYAHYKGLGTCWLCHLPDKKYIRKIFNIPKNFDPIGCLALGYPQKDNENSDFEIDSHYMNKDEYNNHNRLYDINQVMCNNHFYFSYKDCSFVKYPKFNLFKEIKNKLTTLKSPKLCRNKFIPQEHLEYFCIHLVGECNLKCKYCDHFTPLAEGEYLSLEEFEKDFKRLSEITNSNVKRIGLMGGEPLLHPDISKFFPIARKYFPNTEIKLVTNGILLLKQDDNFWKLAKENEIKISCTKYPINIDHEQMEEVAKKNGIEFDFYNYNKETKKSYKIPLDIKGKQNPEYSFANCFHSNWLCFLSKGKLYTCTVAPNVYRFNKFFGKKIPISEKNGIDIYKVKTEKEILNFLAKPIPLCKYCAVKNRVYNIPWERSKKNIDEWT